MPPTHVWEEIWAIPVEVLTDPESPTGDPIVVRKTSEIERAEGHATIGCMVCRQGLNEAFNTDCPGPKEVN